MTETTTSRAPRAPRRGRVGGIVLVLAGLAAGFLLGRVLIPPARTGAGAPGSMDDAGHSANGPAAAPGGLQADVPGAARARVQFWTCGMHPQVIQDHPGTCPICGMKLTPLVTEAAEGDVHGVVIDPVVVQNMGVRTTAVRSGRLHRTLRVAGHLVEPEPARSDITLRFSGWIEKLEASTEGMHVQRGETLFEVYSPELQVAIGELIGARRNLDAAGAAGMAHDLYEAARSKLLLYGLTEGQVDEYARADTPPARVPFLSPRDGHVMERHVLEGSAVKAGDLLLRLSDTRVMWLDMQVHEQDLPFVRIGAPVRATTPAVPGRIFRGDVTFVHPHLDEATRTVLVRSTVRNPTEQLRLGMWASAEIESGDDDPVLLVPQATVLDTGTRRLVWVALGEGHFEAREVQLGSAGDDGLVEVLDGLAEGETVVTSGQFLIDSESRLREAIAKQLAEGLADPGPTGHAH